MQYLNEHDKTACQWLRNLSSAGHLCPLIVDERDIQGVMAGEVGSYKQCHFFAGIGGWPYALQLAGWPTDEPVWTGSCPCQPFSNAGRRANTSDARHLWPEFLRLIDECRPATVFGEQVASKLGREWLSRVRTDLEALGYAIGCADLCAAGEGSPHIRQRLYWVAHLHSERLKRRAEFDGESLSFQQAIQLRHDSSGCCQSLRLEHSESDRREQRRPESDWRGIAGGCSLSRLGDPTSHGWDEGSGGSSRQEPNACWPGVRFWDAYDLVPCGDEKTRRIEPGTFPLAHGIPGRVGRLRGYGNAIVPQVAATFVRSFMEVAGWKWQE